MANPTNGKQRANPTNGKQMVNPTNGIQMVNPTNGILRSYDFQMDTHLEFQQPSQI